MPKRRDICIYLIICFLFNFFYIYSVIKNPFKPVNKKNNREFYLNGILNCDDKKMASIKYDNNTFVVCKGDLIVDANYKIEDILDLEVRILNLETSNEKIIRINN
jgi:hypothetical protein